MKTFKDKVVVVTGVGSGIGRAVAKQLKEKGAKLAVNDFNPDTLQETINLIGGESADIYSKSFDVSNRDAFYQFAKDVHEHFGKVDCIINNAGVALGSVSTEDLTYKDFEWIFGINFWGMVYGTKAFLPLIKQQEEGNITNISSIFGIAGIAYQTAYCTTKFAIRGFTESLRMEMHNESPRVSICSVHPGGIKTNIARDSKPAERKDGELPSDDEDALIEEIEKAFITSPEKAATTILSGILARKERILIGPDAKRADYTIRLFPTKYTDMLLKDFPLEPPQTT